LIVEITRYYSIKQTQFPLIVLNPQTNVNFYTVVKMQNMKKAYASRKKQKSKLSFGLVWF